MKTLFRHLVFFVAGLLTAFGVHAQCGSEMITGHAVVTANKGCAPFYMEIKNLYKNSTADAIYVVDWGDGTVETYNGSADPTDGGSLDPIYTPDFSHTYTEGSAECGHNIIIEATNPCTLPEDARLELQVSIWDNDQQGLNINPNTLRVCQGYAASVTFEDASDWNCYPRAARQNDPPRYIQWVYEGGSMQIPAYAGAPVTGTVTAVNNPGSTSDVINVPAEDPTNPGNPYPVGSEFVVRLNNWNRCNPLGNPPVDITSRIVVVESPSPDFVTKKEQASNPVQTAFCVDDIVYFDNESTGPGGSNLDYTWEFYDGPTDSDPLITTKSNNNPVLAYSTGGTKLVRLTVTDVNAVGGCASVVEKTIDVFPTSIAQINASQTSFCKTEGTPDSFSVTFTDVSTGNTTNTEWKWEFYDESGSLYKTYPATGFSATSLGPFTETYTNPGRYKVVMIAKDGVTGCFTNDEKFINVYLKPDVDFTAGAACENSDVAFYNQTTFTSINGNKIDTWEWDFDYDGSTFAADESYSGSMPDTIYQQLPAGKHQVALRVTEDQNGCSEMVVKEIDVQPMPLAQFTKDKVNDCSPLELTVENTGHAAGQPTTIDQYIWSVDYGAGYVDTLTQDPDEASYDTTALFTFRNENATPKFFKFRLKAVSDAGCVSMSLPDSVEVFPSFKPGFNYSNYDPLANNCAPLDIQFQVDQATRDLNPDGYDWSVTKDSNVVHTESKPSGDPQFEYEFTASGINVNEYKVKLEAEVPGICMQDSILTIKVNPIPVSDFSIDTLDFTCDSLSIEVEANQKGLVTYDWTITDGSSIYYADTLGDKFTYSVGRPAIGASDRPLKFELMTENFTFCESDSYKDSLSVLEKVDIGAEFSASPSESVFPNSLTFIDNNTNAGDWDYLWDFGDGTTSSDINPGYHDYDSIGTFKVKLTAQGAFCIETDTQTVKIKAPPLYVDFDYDPSTGCAPLTVKFTNESINAEPDTYNWDFGDGNTSVVANPTYTYDEPGIYSVSLTATNADGLTLTEEKNNIIVVVEPPDVNINVDPKIRIYPEATFNIENNSVTHTGSAQYLWNFGDGVYTIEENPLNHTYEVPGEYYIKLAVTEGSCRREDSVGVKVEDPAEAIVDFDFKPNNGCVPLTVEFLNQTVGAEEGSYIWDFGDGQGLSYEENPEHTYYEPGVYTVTLRARNISGVESKIVKDSVITVHAYPDADFTVDPEFQVFPEADVTLTNNSVAEGRKYYWNFGDGNETKEESPETHTYGEPGRYNITFAVEENGCETVDSAKVFIKPIPPVVDFEFDPASGCAPLTVQFTNKSKYADPSTYEWDFGDGYGSSNKKNPVYTFYEPGLYTVSLSATNQSGVVVTEVKERIIEVFEVPVASFHVRPDRVHIPDEQIHMTNRTNGATSYIWDFGDGTVSDDFEPSHDYSEEGFYNIKLIATSEKGCSDTVEVEDAVEAILEDKVSVPNAFTPSLDGPTDGHVNMTGTNDVFYPITRGVSEYKMQIFNRWGELIFETANKNYGWNGYHNGKICPQDVYIYKIDVKYLDGEEDMIFGDVTLIR